MKNIIQTTKRIKYEDNYYLIVPNVASGHRGRYTVYEIPPYEPNVKRRIKIVGRELPLGFARKYVKQLQNSKSGY